MRFLGVSLRAGLSAKSFAREVLGFGFARSTVSRKRIPLPSLTQSNTSINYNIRLGDKKQIPSKN